MYQKVYHVSVNIYKNNFACLSNYLLIIYSLERNKKNKEKIYNWRSNMKKTKLCTQQHQQKFNQACL